jgi:ubiquinone/menaquinone biosynthesis C-methylase UbiE
MSFYDRHVLPRLLDLAMRNSEVARYRARLVPRAAGAVLEIGIGSGLNLPFYGERVERLAGIDPSPELLAMTRKRAAGSSFPVELIARGAESLPLEAASADCAVTTFSLCTIPDPLAALREVHRVLRPGGSVIFAEHGLSPDVSVARWQHRLNPWWRALAGGCNLDRRIDALLTAAGFEITEITREYAHGPKPLAYVYSGVATPRCGTAIALPG